MPTQSKLTVWLKKSVARLRKPKTYEFIGPDGEIADLGGVSLDDPSSSEDQSSSEEEQEISLDKTHGDDAKQKKYGTLIQKGKATEDPFASIRTPILTIL